MFLDLSFLPSAIIQKDGSPNYSTHSDRKDPNTNNRNSNRIEIEDENKIPGSGHLLGTASIDLSVFLTQQVSQRQPTLCFHSFLCHFTLVEEPPVPFLLLLAVSLSVVVFCVG
jgi:hypothetical protein